MGLEQELTQVQGGCKLCEFLSALPEGGDDGRANWTAQLARPVKTIGHLSVARALIRRGVPITETSVRRHRENHR